MQPLCRAGFKSQSATANPFARDSRSPLRREVVAVVVIPGDVALKPFLRKFRLGSCRASPSVRPNSDDIAALAAMLNGATKVTLMCGAGCNGAHSEVIELARRLKAPIVHFTRKRTHRIRQSLRRRHDRAGGLCVRLQRDEGLRHAACFSGRVSLIASSIPRMRKSRRSTCVRKPLAIDALLNLGVLGDSQIDTLEITDTADRASNRIKTISTLALADYEECPPSLDSADGVRSRQPDDPSSICPALW